MENYHIRCTFYCCLLHENALPLSHCAPVNPYVHAQRLGATHLPLFKQPFSQVGCPQCVPINPFWHIQWSSAQEPPFMHLMLHCWIDFEPQVGAIWPFGHVQMFGREQNPSPHEFLQIGTIHWFPPGNVFHPGQQYEWKRDPQTFGPFSASWFDPSLRDLLVFFWLLSLAASGSSSAAPTLVCTAMYKNVVNPT